MSDWIKCSDRLPDCPHECTTDHTMVSHSLLLTSIHDPGSLAMGHMRKDGSWKLYGGDYDFMELETITHWQMFPEPVTYTATHLQIGCQLHTIAEWWAFSAEEIAAMDSQAAAWWAVWKPILQNIIETSPAVPGGEPKPEPAEPEQAA